MNVLNAVKLEIKRYNCISSNTELDLPKNLGQLPIIEEKMNFTTFCHWQDHGQELEKQMMLIVFWFRRLLLLCMHMHKKESVSASYWPWYQYMIHSPQLHYSVSSK